MILAARPALRGTKFGGGGGGTPVVERFAFTTGQERGRAPKDPALFPKRAGPTG